MADSAEPAGPQKRGINPLAVASLAFGILWIFWVGSVLAVILGYFAGRQIRRSDQRGDALAVLGMLIGCIEILVGLVYAMVGGSSYQTPGA